MPKTIHKLDIHQLLKRHRQIAIIWSIEDVQQIRPDLTSHQAWEVLQACEAHHDCELGITWLTLESTADDLFPLEEASLTKAPEALC